MKSPDICQQTHFHRNNPKPRPPDDRESDALGPNEAKRTKIRLDLGEASIYVRVVSTQSSSYRVPTDQKRCGTKYGTLLSIGGVMLLLTKSIDWIALRSSFGNPA